MDGNGRWAKDRGLARTAGHEAGEKVLFDLVEAAIGFGVKELSAKPYRNSFNSDIATLFRIFYPAPNKSR